MSRLAFILFLFFEIALIHAQTFTEVSHSAGISHINVSFLWNGGGTAFFDYNNDGWEDIYIIGGNAPDRLFRNNSNGTFTDVGLLAGITRYDTSYTMGVTTGDIDNDGDRDIFVTRYHRKATPIIDSTSSILFRNNGNGTFTDISQSAGITQYSWGMSASMGDYNLDGWLDIYVANYVKAGGVIFNSQGEVIGYSPTGFRNFLYLNYQDGTFTEVATQLGVNDNGTSLATAFTDYDNDHDPDIFVVNDYGAWVIPNQLFRNEYPANSFTNVSVSSGANAGIYGMGIAIGDYDEDGDLDYYSTNVGYNVLYNNNGNGTFTNVAQQAGVANGYLYILNDTFFTIGWGAVFFDYDNDTRLDLFVADGFIDTAPFQPGALNQDPNKLYKNNGDGTFTDVSAIAGVDDTRQARGMASGDYDNDGDLDVLVVNTNNDEMLVYDSIMFYRNDEATGNHWLKVKLQGTQNNRDGIGSRVEVYSSGRKFIREIDGGSSYASQNSCIAHFGMGSYTTTDSIVVIWPGGRRQSILDVPVDHLIRVLEGGQSQLVHHEYYDLCDDDSLLAGGSYQTSSGTYYDTMLSGGLISVLISHLIIHPVTVTHNLIEVCEGDSVFYNGAYHQSDTLFYDTLSAATGCDSVIITSLTVSQIPITLTDALICEGDSFFAGGGWQQQAGTFYDSMQSAICNQVIITNLAVFPTGNPDTVHTFICPGDSALAGGAYQSANGYYSDLYQNSLGCDSLVITLLEVFSPQPSFLKYDLCGGDSLLFGGIYITESGTYNDTLSSSSGCDSIVVYIVAADSSYEIHTTLAIQEGDSFFVGGDWQMEPGIYLDSNLTANGCDSIIHTDLQLEGSNFIAAPDSTYFSIYPNPANENFIVSYFLPVSDHVVIEIHSLTGTRIILFNGNRATGDHAEEIERNWMLPGVYIVSFKSSSSVRFEKVVIY